MKCNTLLWCHSRSPLVILGRPESSRRLAGTCRPDTAETTAEAQTKKSALHHQTRMLLLSSDVLEFACACTARKITGQGMHASLITDPIKSKPESALRMHAHQCVKDVVRLSVHLLRGQHAM